jgi:precorrin-6Y C5,15-methyltransferase (decarboxylating)
VVAVPGRAPEALCGLPAPDSVFLGGSGGNLGGILDHLEGLNAPLRWR